MSPNQNQPQNEPAKERPVISPIFYAEGNIKVEHFHQAGSAYTDQSTHIHYEYPTEDAKVTDAQPVDADSTSCQGIPSDLQSPFILECLNKFVNAGYLTAQFQPVNPKKCPWTLASVIARVIGEKAELSNFYQAFGELWSHHTLAKDYQGLLNRNKHTVEIEQQIQTIIST